MWLLIAIKFNKNNKENSFKELQKYILMAINILINTVLIGQLQTIVMFMDKIDIRDLTEL